MITEKFSCRCRPVHPCFLIIFILSLSVISGCSTAGRFAAKPLPMNVPGVFSGAGSSNPAALEENWTPAFGDPELEQLIDEALLNNLDLRLVSGRVSSALLVAKDERSGLYPALSAGAKATRSRNVSESEGKVFQGTDSSHSLSLDMAWEADLWGRISMLARASDADYKASKADVRGARLSISGQVARAWFELTSARLQARLAGDVEESYIRSRRILQRRYRAGLNTAMDLNLLKNSEADARNRRLTAEQDALVRARTLETLLGRYPSGSIMGGKKLTRLRRDVPPGLPSDLLNRRPDIVAARLRVLAADLRTGAAEKARLPQITLTAGGGLSSSGLKTLVRSDHLIWNLMGGLTQPVFDAGRKKRAVLKAENEAKQAWLSYSQTVLKAFREVENALSLAVSLRQRESVLKVALAAAEAASRQAWQKYLAGDIDIISVLESRRRVLNAKTELIEIGTRRLSNRVTLHMALGGSADLPSDKTSTDLIMAAASH